MRLSGLGVTVIQTFEDFAPVAYRKFPHEPWTAGWGHTGPDVTEGTQCTPEQGGQWLIQDVARAEEAVTQAVQVALTRHQFDALVSLVYNTGTEALRRWDGGAWKPSTLLKLLNSGASTQAAADQFLLWNHVNGVVVAGLTRRRTLERALFLD